MARQYKSLRHNLEDGIDIPNHREHRSKRGRKKDAKIKHLQRKVLALNAKRMKKRFVKQNIRRLLKGELPSMTT